MLIYLLFLREYISICIKETYFTFYCNWYHLIILNFNYLSDILLSILNAFFIISFQVAFMGMPSNCRIIFHTSNLTSLLFRFKCLFDSLALNFALTCLKNNSTGEREGEYGGRKYALIFKSLNFLIVHFALWIEALSKSQIIFSSLIYFLNVNENFKIDK